MKRILIPIIAVLGIIGVSCGSFDEYATSTSDTHVCVFDGSERGGQKLKYQIAPGAESKKVDENDKAIKIPASNRFYMASMDATRDPGAPQFYTGFAKGSVPVQIQGQVRFRFDLKKACEWYSEHGRRNANDDGDLGFNARGEGASAEGWFKFLNENFGVTMSEIVSETAARYDWPAMVYNYPTNADETGTVPEGTEPGEATGLALGRDLGASFSDRLAANLGGEFFCGIDEGSEEECPPMRFQVVAVHTQDPALEAQRQKLETTRQTLRDQELEGRLREQQAESLARAEAAKQTELRNRLATAQLEADIAAAPCKALTEANPNVGCDGKLPTVIVGGQ